MPAKITNKNDRTVIWILKSLAKQIRDLANEEGTTMSKVAERDLVPAIARRHRRMRERQLAEMQRADLGEEG